MSSNLVLFSRVEGRSVSARDSESRGNSRVTSHGKLSGLSLSLYEKSLKELPTETRFVVLGRCGNFDDLQP